MENHDERWKICGLTGENPREAPEQGEETL